MANALYDKGREGFLDGTIDWDTDNIKVALIDTGVYTVNLSTHSASSDLLGIVDETANLSSKTVTDGVADAADETITAVTGVTVEALVIYQDTGTPGTSRLIAYIDTATGLPLTPNGGDVTIEWDRGSNRIYKL